MSQFLESILLHNGSFPLLDYHQARINRTLTHHNGLPLELDLIINKLSFPDLGVFKFRLKYDLIGNYESQCLVYQQKLITSLQCIEVGDYAYAYKYSERTSIQQFYNQKATADDILMIKDGKVTDTSYGNVAFYDKGMWMTPKTSLLNGCRRQYLLSQKVILEKYIGIEDLLQFQYISIFNALIPLGRILIPTSKILLPRKI